ncbi:MAG: ADP-ribosylglycohydrolase family protein [Planctomycetes bacterium]|nr:ADP-ribosylglycohydrolase family protein [Planctomycetota bacterium]
MTVKTQAIDFSKGKMCVPGGDTRAGLVRWELFAAEEEGRGRRVRERLAKLSQKADEKGLLDIYEQALAIPDDPKLDCAEPYDLESIRRLRPKAKQRTFETPRGDEAWLYDRLYGAWLGRCAGCTLGGPGETFRPHTRERLIKYLTAVSPDEWPIRDYMPAHSPCDLKFTWKMDATRENLRYAPADDDLTHTMIAQIALRELQQPDQFQSRDLASVWFRVMPYALMEGGTGMMAFRNLVLRYPMNSIRWKQIPDQDIDWYWVATHSNPYRFDIDAGIRADSYGYAAPGLPELAADLAWRDARTSNTRTGLYCSMFYAATIAAAFALDDPLAVVKAGLAEIPATSRLAAAIRKMIQICRKHGLRPERILDVQEENIAVFSGHDCSTFSNVAAIVSSLLMGGGDFGNAIRFTVMAGLDSDSTAATSGSIAGAMLGARRLPAKWIKPLNDTVHGNIVGYQPIAISECARRSLEICRRVPDSAALAAAKARKRGGA